MTARKYNPKQVIMDGLDIDPKPSPEIPEDRPLVTIYTDGGCDPNPGVGGWGAVLMCGAHHREISGSAPESTNNRMEMTAAIEALSALKRPSAVVLHTDSQYLQKGVTEWMPNWKRKNWQRKTGPVKNEDLWRKLDELVSRHKISWRWVRGHAGDTYNERCDQLAAAAIQSLRDGLTCGR